MKGFLCRFKKLKFAPVFVCWKILLHIHPCMSPFFGRWHCFSQSVKITGPNFFWEFLCRLHFCFTFLMQFFLNRIFQPIRSSIRFIFFHLFRFIRSITGILNYKYRIIEAKKLLSDKSTEKFSLNYIAEAVGFGSVGTFIRVFRDFEDTTPGKFREETKAGTKHS